MKKLLAVLILLSMTACTSIAAPDDGDCPPDQQQECGVTGPNGAQRGVTGPNG